jgi:phage terminase large subunit
VYPDFDPAIHVIDTPNITNEWRRFRSIDFGHTNPFVCQWWAIDPDGRMYLYRELYGTKRIVEDWAKLIHKHSAGESYEVTISDHDAEDRATLERHGISTRPAFKAFAPGRDGVEARLRVAGDGKPRLYICRNALLQRDESLSEAYKPLCTEQEFEAYVYPKDSGGRATKEDPVKEHDHGMDAMRYAVAYVDKIGSQSVEVRVIGGGAPRVRSNW